MRFLLRYVINDIKPVYGILDVLSHELTVESLTDRHNETSESLLRTQSKIHR